MIKDSYSQGKNSADKKKYCEAHNNYNEEGVCDLATGDLTDNILPVQKVKEAIKAIIANEVFSVPNPNSGNKSGNTPPTKNICPRLANILETTFVCSNDNLCSIS